jgi:hypothetical protein
MVERRTPSAPRSPSPSPSPRPALRPSRPEVLGHPSWIGAPPLLWLVASSCQSCAFLRFPQARRWCGSVEVVGLVGVLCPVDGGGRGDAPAAPDRVDDAMSASIHPLPLPSSRPPVGHPPPHTAISTTQLLLRGRTPSPTHPCRSLC